MRATYLLFATTLSVGMHASDAQTQTQTPPGARAKAGKSQYAELADSLEKRPPPVDAAQIYSELNGMDMQLADLRNEPTVHDEVEQLAKDFLSLVDKAAKLAADTQCESPEAREQLANAVDASSSSDDWARSRSLWSRYSPINGVDELNQFVEQRDLADKYRRRSVAQEQER